MINASAMDFFQTIFDQSSDGIVITDQHGLILQANQAFASFYKYKLPDLIGKPFWSILPIDQQEPSQARFLEMLSTAESGTSFETLILGEGTSSLLLETTLYFTEPIGKRTKMLALVRDVTGKRFEEQIKLIIKNASIVLWSLDKEGRFTLSEGKALEKLGFAPGDAVGFSAFELYNFNATFIENLHKTFAGEAVEFETFGTYLDQPVAFRHFLQPTRNKHGEITGLLGLSIDVTQEYLVKESEQRYRALANSIPGAAVFQAEVQPDLSRKVTFISENVHRSGIAPEESHHRKSLASAEVGSDWNSGRWHCA